MLAEYVRHKTLAKLGITVDASKIPASLCDAFLVFERVIDDLQAEENKKASKR